jgi:uncharacterized protein YcbK (DUF882 family)
MTEKQIIELLKAATNEYLSRLEAIWKTIETDSQVVVAAPTVKPISHFGSSELACKHCGKVGPYAENYSKLVAKLEKLRAAIGNKPIHILSAYRCPTHNAEVGGASNSYHMQDMACDIYVDGMSVDQLANAAVKVGFGGIGRYYDQDFVHVDVGPVADWQQGSKSLEKFDEVNEKIRKEG